jgi:hypothetical protein
LKMLAEKQERPALPLCWPRRESASEIVYLVQL